jgi:mycothiol system anti-sigma-R factor
MAHVDEFIDGELGARECEGVEAHLLTCPGCRAAFQRELDLKNIVRKACACSGVPDELRVRVLTRISQLRIDVEATTFESLTIRTSFGTGGLGRDPGIDPLG